MVRDEVKRCTKGGPGVGKETSEVKQVDVRERNVVVNNMNNNNNSNKNIKDGKYVQCSNSYDHDIKGRIQSEHMHTAPCTILKGQFGDCRDCTAHRMAVYSDRFDRI